MGKFTHEMETNKTLHREALRIKVTIFLVLLAEEKNEKI